eukprot:gnl/TRDRNA2_/TRDRNA2_125450_c0_seq2.p1 gnl/TRDRNA2_/TRDRNA2_125450_c0~~gnl/TRDRNA2_/TRDRNA2_125450_c0_seq2.p1  ORF type:complete len:833 (+),score=61.14 gnl/TRDRNA2_/TRDRNA2_125450_c0_seq2:1-2499(+)
MRERNMFSEGKDHGRCIGLLSLTESNTIAVATRPELSESDSVKFYKCFSHDTFAWNIATAQSTLVLVGIFAFFPTRLFLTIVAMTEFLIWLILKMASSPTLTDWPSFFVGSAVITTVLSVSACQYVERYCRIAFLFEQHARDGDVAADLLKNLRASNGNVIASKITSLVSTALQRESQLMGIAMMGVDAVVKVELCDGHDVVVFRPTSESRRQHLQMLLGASEMPTCIEEVLADEERARWAAYKSRCRNARRAASNSSPAESAELIRMRLRGDVPAVDFLLSLGQDGSTDAYLGLRLPLEGEGQFVAAMMPSVQSERQVAASMPSNFDQGAQSSNVPLPMNTGASAPLLHDRCPTGDAASIPSHAPSSRRSVTARDAADCLPPDSLVWVLGVEEPQPLKAVHEGQKVLTFDASRNPPTFYTSVQSISHNRSSETTHWVRVVLSDGSTVCTTGDHAFWPAHARNIKHSPIGAVRARDLLPGVDALWVQRPRLVTVVKIDSMSMTGEQAGRIRLELECPKGHSEPQVLVADPEVQEKETGELCLAHAFVAVGDATAQTADTRLDALLNSYGISHSQKTPGAFELLDTAPFHNFRRSHSEPDISMLSHSDPEIPAATFENGEIEKACSIGSNVSSCLKPSLEDSSISHRTSDSSSVYSSAGFPRVVELGGIDSSTAWWRRGPSGGGLRLSDYQALPMTHDGQKMSFGSLGHVLLNEPGPCKVCAYAQKANSSCRYGSLCERCHVSHGPFVKKWRRRRGRTVPRNPGEVVVSETSEAGNSMIDILEHDSPETAPVGMPLTEPPDPDTGITHIDLSEGCRLPDQVRSRSTPENRIWL